MYLLLQNVSRNHDLLLLLYYLLKQGKSAKHTVSLVSPYQYTFSLAGVDRHIKRTDQFQHENCFFAKQYAFEKLVIILRELSIHLLSDAFDRNFA